MASSLVDYLFYPYLVPALMLINSYKLLEIDKPDPTYMTIAFGCQLSFLYDTFQHQLNSRRLPRSKLAIFTSALLTTTVISAILGFNILRNNFYSSYKLATSLKGPLLNENSDLFRYHFITDIVPGLILFAQVHLCHLINYELLHRARRNFSIRESSIVSQLMSASSALLALTIYTDVTGSGPFTISVTSNIALSVGNILFFVAFLPSYLTITGKAYIRRSSLIVLALSVAYWRVQDIIGKTYERNPIYWAIDYLFGSHQTISLFCLWLALTAACIGFSNGWSSMGGQTNSLVRKGFHLAICVVFVTGYNQDIEFTKFAAGGVLSLMLLCEMIRAWRLPFLGERLEIVCKSLRGSWDNRFLTVSHMYLLVGTFISIWLTPTAFQHDKLTISAGFIAVGVGDTAAAVTGTFLGKTRISKKSAKTVEGLLGNVASMIVCQLIWIGYSDFVSQFSFILAAFCTAIVEATSEGCDNLILPLALALFLEVFKTVQ